MHVLIRPKFSYFATSKQFVFTTQCCDSRVSCALKYYSVMQASRVKTRDLNCDLVELTRVIEEYYGLLLRNTLPYLEDITFKENPFAQVPGSFSLDLKMCLAKASHTYLKATRLDFGALPMTQALKLVEAVVNQDTSITHLMAPEQESIHNFLSEYSKHLSEKVLEFTTKWKQTAAMPYEKSRLIKIANEIRVTTFQQYMRLYLDGVYSKKLV